MMKKCPKCGYVRQESDVPPEFPEHECPSCGIIYAKFGQTVGVTRPVPVRRVATTTSTDEAPTLSKVFFVLAALSLIGGLILTVTFWPKSSELESGYSYKAVAYTASLIWLTAGIIETALFAAIGQVLVYLNRIAKNTAPE